MGKVVTDVTLETFPTAVREAGLRPGQRFTVIVQDDAESRVQALEKIQHIADAVSAKAATDGVVTDQQVRTFLQSLDDER